MAMMPGGSSGGSRTASPFVIDRDDGSSLDNDHDLLAADDGMFNLSPFPERSLCSSAMIQCGKDTMASQSSAILTLSVRSNRSG